MNLERTQERSSEDWRKDSFDNSAFNVICKVSFDIAVSVSFVDVYTLFM